MTIKLHDYRYEPTISMGDTDRVLKYQFKYNGTMYVAIIELNIHNVPLIYLCEGEDLYLKFVSETGENLYQIFNKIEITENELMNYCNNYLLEIEEDWRF